MDIHSGQIQGFFDVPVDHLYAAPIARQYFTKKYKKDLIIASPDAGGMERARRFAKKFGDLDLVVTDKRRPKPNVSEITNVIGNVKNKHVLLIDDMIDTGGTIVGAAELLAEKGAKEVFACTTHGVFSDPAIERIQNSVIKEVAMTNTLPLPEHKQIPKIKVLSVAQIIASALDAVFEDTSVSEIFGGKHLS